MLAQLINMAVIYFYVFILRSGHIL